MKKTLILLMAILCLAGCKPEPDLPDDPHVPLINPFPGVWSVGMGGEYWQFKTDGTGGRANAAEGPFPETFSFFVYAGQDVQTAPSRGTLVLLNDAGGASVAVTRYKFSIESITMQGVTMIHANLTVQTYDRDAGENQDGASLLLHRESGAPVVLSLTNPLTGEWLANWTGSHYGDGRDNPTWSLKYRADGTVKTYHHGLHQFENGYALRHNTLVIFGLWRFSIEPVIAEITISDSIINVQETQSYPLTVDWIYTKVSAAEWK